MKKSESILWGAVLIALGAVFALKAFDIISINIFFDGWWTLFIIVPCIIGLFTGNEKTGNLIGIFIGVFLLLCCQGILSFSLIWKLAIPVIVIVIGIKMILVAVFGKTGKALKVLENSGAEFKKGNAAFAGNEMNFDGEIFDGAELNAVFGGINCDIRGAIIDRDCVITASAVFGGIDIYAPDNINIIVNSNSVFGGVSNKKHINSPQNLHTLYVNATCIFGGVEIK